jgi:hypothetical protein
MDINTGNVTWVNPKYLKHANVGRGLSAGADVLTTGIAYNQIADGSAQPIPMLMQESEQWV